MDKKLTELADDLFNSIKNIFPKNSDFIYKHKPQKDTYVMRVQWESNYDPTCSYKISRIILIQITLDALRYYQDSSIQDKKNAKKRLLTIIGEKFKNFKPEHEDSKHTQQLIENWLIESKMLNNLIR